MKVWGAIAIAAALAGCAATISPRIQANLAQAQDRPVPCADTCKLQWERAQLWLVQHSAWKLQMATDVVLQTYNPPAHDVTYGFQVTRTPAGSGYVIALQLVCGNMYGCDPLPADVRRAFYHYVATGDDLLAGAGYLGAIR